MKTNKSIKKRIKVTASGKFLRRFSSQNHFNAKARRVTQLRAKQARAITGPFERKVREALAHA